MGDVKTLKFKSVLCTTINKKYNYLEYLIRTTNGKKKIKCFIGILKCLMKKIINSF